MYLIAARESQFDSFQLPFAIYIDPSSLHIL